MSTIPVEKIRNDFPLLKNWIYLDNAATTQTPYQVIHAMHEYYTSYRANVHRGIYELEARASEAYNYAHALVARFIGADFYWIDEEKDFEFSELIFTSGATQSLNLVAESLSRGWLKKGDRVVVTAMEHHSNLVPWIRIAQEKGLELRYVEFDEEGELKLDQLESLVDDNTRVVSVTLVSNFLGTINPIEKIADIAHKKGALLVVDGAQGVPHMKVDVKRMDCDFLAFSAHKMLGPTGVGALFGKRELLEKMEPYEYGGDMISDVERYSASWNRLPWKFEAGTPKIAEGIGFGAAVEYLNKLGMEQVRAHDYELIRYALKRLEEVPRLKIFGPSKPEKRGGLVSFVFEDVEGVAKGPHAHDVADYLARRRICIRAGHHCTLVAHKTLGVSASARMSTYIYNTKSEIDAFVDSLIELEKKFRS